MPAGEEDATRAAHAGFYLAMMEQTETVLWASANKTTLDEIENEHDNLRAALTWSLANEPETALRLAGALGQFWSKRSYWVEGQVMAGTRPRVRRHGRDRANEPSRSDAPPRSPAIKGSTRKRHGISKSV